MRKISEIEANLPPIEQKKVQEIKKSISSGMKNFSQEEMDELI